MARFSRTSLAFAVAGALTNFLPRVASAQHITVDGRFSPAQTLVGPNYSISANLGKQVGSNLFHSFGQFGLATGESAAFSGPTTVNNVIGRVTGGNLSSIDGKIQSNIAGANLYLINPSGIVFGPNATVNVSGSFHASTADYLKMSDGAKFQATNPNGSTLSAAPPAAFGFLTASPAKITVNGSTLGPVPGTLGLIGGPVSITAASPNTPSGATLSAPGGTIQVTSVAGTGEVPVDPRNTPALTVTSFGAIDISGSADLIGANARSSRLDVSNPNGLGSGGSVFIRSGALTISNGEINADNYGSGRGGQLVIQADNQIAMTNATLVHSTARSSGTGAAVIVSTAPSGDISIDESAVQTGGFGAGTTGPIAVSSGQLKITNQGAISSFGFGNGDAGSVTVAAGQLSMINGSIESEALGNGNGGNVVVAVSGALSIDGTFTNGSGILAGGYVTNAFGNGGSVTVSAGTLSIHNALISSDAFGGGSGGSVLVNVAGQLTIDGSNSQRTPFRLTGTGITSQTAGGGNAGNVTVNAGAFSILNGGGILTGTGGAGAAGSIAIVVAGDTTISGGALISSPTAGAGQGGIVGITARGPLTLKDAGTGITASATPTASGNAGSVRVSASQITITSGAEIASTTAGTGAGGSVMVTTPGMLVLDGAGVANTQIAASATGPQSGPGGSVTVGAGGLTIEGGALIASSTAGLGKAGDVAMTVANGLTLSGVGPNGASGVTASTQPGSSGQAGQVVLTAGGAIALSGGAEVTTSTAGAGNGGTVQVTAQGALILTDPGTGIIASAEPGSSGNAGSVVAAAPQMTIASGAEIASTTAGTGMGGSIRVTTPGTLVLDGAGLAGNTEIAASSTGTQSGSGGSVTVAADALTIEGGARIASTTFGPGKAGDVAVIVANGVTLSGTGPTARAASPRRPSSGRAVKPAKSFDRRTARSRCRAAPR